MIIDAAVGKILVFLSMGVVSVSLLAGSRHQPFPEISRRFGWLLASITALSLLGESAPRPMELNILLSIVLVMGVLRCSCWSSSHGPNTTGCVHCSNVWISLLYRGRRTHGLDLAGSQSVGTVGRFSRTGCSWWWANMDGFQGSFDRTTSTRMEPSGNGSPATRSIGRSTRGNHLL